LLEKHSEGRILRKREGSPGCDSRYDECEEDDEGNPTMDFEAEGCYWKNNKEAEQCCTSVY
jgi:hypothetical protein